MIIIKANRLKNTSIRHFCTQAISLGGKYDLSYIIVTSYEVCSGAIWNSNSDANQRLFMDTCMNVVKSNFETANVSLINPFKIIIVKFWWSEVNQIDELH